MYIHIHIHIYTLLASLSLVRAHPDLPHVQNIVPSILNGKIKTAQGKDVRTMILPSLAFPNRFT